ncbi:MAG: hypothetical protein ACRDE5_08420 [Ginsengibacter sp.]
MKQQAKKIIAIVILCLAINTTYSQQKSSITPGWVSDKGYWVVESNIHNSKNHIVRFYNNEDQLIYIENLTGTKLNTDKRKVKMKLKKALETAMNLYEQHKEASEIKSYVVKILR